MARKILVNTTRVGTAVHVAGSSHDTILDPRTCAGITSAGGKLVDPTPIVQAAADLALAAHAKGTPTETLDTLMLTAAGASDAASVTYDDLLALPHIGAGNVQDAIDYLKAHGGGPTPVGDPNALAFFNPAGALSDNPDLLVRATGTYGRPEIWDRRMNGGGTAWAVWRQGAWEIDGDPMSAKGSGFVTYGSNAVNAGPNSSAGGMGFYTSHSWGALHINGAGGGNTYYTCGSEDGSDDAPGFFPFKNVYNPGYPCNPGFATCDDAAGVSSFIERLTGKAWFRALSVDGAYNAPLLLLSGVLDSYGRPQIRDIRQGTGGAANAVWRQGAWQVDGDSADIEGDGVVIYGKDPVSGLQDGLNGAFARVKCDRFAIRLITGGVDVGYGFRVDLTELYFKDNAGAQTVNVNRLAGRVQAKQVVCESTDPIIVSHVREGTLPYDPTSLVYRTPVGCYFADNAADVRVWHNATELTYGVDFVAYYNGMFNPGYEQPLSVRDASSGIKLAALVSSGTIRIQWIERTLPVAPAVVGVARFYYDGLWWVPDTLNPWNITNPATIPNTIYVSKPPDGYVLELWRMTKHVGGITPHGKVGHGMRMLPYLRGPQVGVTENDRAMVMDTTHIPNIQQHRRKFRVCWYNPTTRVRSLHANQLIVLCGANNGDRHNGNGTVRARYSLWIEGT